MIFRGRGEGCWTAPLSDCLIKRVKDPFDFDADPDTGHAKFF